MTEDRIVFADGVGRLVIRHKNGQRSVVLFDEPFARELVRRGRRVQIVIAREYKYAFVRISGKMVLLHRQVVDAPRDKLVDHDNHNTLDNRRFNLKVVSNSRNLLNRRGATRRSKSGVRGCYYKTEVKLWVAQVRVNKKTRHLGYFKTLEAAARVQSAEVAKLLLSVP